MKIFLDSANLEEMLSLQDKVDGFTTNPTLMRKANVQNYKDWAQGLLKEIKDKSISFEVISDDFEEMERQARLLASWGQNVYVKIPITNTKGESSISLITKLAKDINVNVTAVMDFGQEWGQKEGELGEILKPTDIVSFFCGRMMDTQKQPISFSGWINPLRYQKLWASTREVFNLVMAEERWYDIITLTPDLIAKLPLKGKDLTQYSLETVQMFYNDAQKAGYQI